MHAPFSRHQRMNAPFNRTSIALPDHANEHAVDMVRRGLDPVGPPQIVRHGFREFEMIVDRGLPVSREMNKMRMTLRRAGRSFRMNPTFLEAFQA